MVDVDALERKILNHDAVIGIVGLGYVGLPVAVTFAEAGYQVVGIELREEKVELLEQGKSHLRDVPDDRVRPLRESGRLRASSSFEAIGQVDVVIITVPTPLQKGSPDLSNVVFAGEELGKVLKAGALVVLESTTYPGTTDELLQPLLEAGGLKAGIDFALAFSPERIDPGNPDYEFSDIPKVVGGIDEASTRITTLLYEQVVSKVVTVSSPREAEMSKLIENIFRHVNIALISELAVYAHEMDIDIWEAIEAASSKPFGYMPFWPSAGWGGHCIPLDPSYLSWRVRQHRSHEIRFIELAQTINSEMTRYALERISLLLNDVDKAVRGSRILGVGVAYKAGSQDTRESGGIKILSMLAGRGARIDYHDPLVPEVDIGGVAHASIDLSEEVVRDYDLTVVLTAQTGVDWELIARHAPLVFDCANALKRTGGNIHRL